MSKCKRPTGQNATARDPGCEELVDAVAHRVVELLDERDADRATSRLVNAATIADALGVTVAWVYDHADELGARPLTNGKRPRLRFDLNEALAAIAPSSPAGDPTRDRPGATLGRSRTRLRRTGEPGSVLAIRPDSRRAA